MKFKLPKSAIDLGFEPIEKWLADNEGQHWDSSESAMVLHHNGKIGEKGKSMLQKNGGGLWLSGIVIGVQDRGLIQQPYAEELPPSITIEMDDGNLDIIDKFEDMLGEIGYRLECVDPYEMDKPTVTYELVKQRGDDAPLLEFEKTPRVPHGRKKVKK